MPLSANDSDASVALGGVQLTREPRISMESERLTISLSKITVEYEFLNESDKDITTDVAFPIPPYENTERAEAFGTSTTSSYGWMARDYRMRSRQRRL